MLVGWFWSIAYSPQQSIEKPLNIVPEINKIITININTHLIEEILNDESSNYILSQSGWISKISRNEN
jgi:hypothetical protein